MKSPATIVLTLILMLCATSSAVAQSFTISNDRMTALIRQADAAGYILYIADRFSVTGPMGRLRPYDFKTQFSSRQLNHYMVTILAARLVDKGIISLDMPLFPIFPDYELGEYFAVAVTPRHLMSQTAGFSVPLSYDTMDTRPKRRLTMEAMIKPIRGAGERPHDDPVATALLVETLEKLSGRSLADLLISEIALPLGFTADDIIMDKREDPISQALPSMAFSGRLVMKLSENLSFDGRDKDNNRFLSSAVRETVMNQMITAHHPYGHLRASGASHFAHKGHMVKTTAFYCHPTPFGDAGLFTLNTSSTFFLLVEKDDTERQGKPCLQQAGIDLMTSIIDIDLRGAKASERYQQMADLAREMAEPETLPDGIYLIDTRPTHWFKDREQRIKDQSIKISYLPSKQQLIVAENQDDDIIKLYTKKGPMHFESADGSVLLFSKAADGGYLSLDGVPYRHVGALGMKLLMIDLYGLYLLVTFSMVLHWRSTTGFGWPRMAKIVGISTVVFAICVELERHFAADLYYYSDLYWLSSLWRFPLNFALMGVITMPFFALKFTKNNQMPKKPVVLVATNIQLTLGTASSIALFLWAMAINVSGNFLP